MTNDPSMRSSLDRNAVVASSMGAGAKLSADTTPANASLGRWAMAPPPPPSSPLPLALTPPAQTGRWMGGTSPPLPAPLPPPTCGALPLVAPPVTASTTDERKESENPFDSEDWRIDRGETSAIVAVGTGGIPPPACTWRLVARGVSGADPECRRSCRACWLPEDSAHCNWESCCSRCCCCCCCCCCCAVGIGLDGTSWLRGRWPT